MSYGRKARVTKSDALLVLRAVRKAFKPYIDAGCEEPVLEKGWDFFGYGPTPYAIVWEGGPFEWAVQMTLGGRDEFGRNVEPLSNPLPSGDAYAEPITSWSLGIYPVWSNT